MVQKGLSPGWEGAESWLGGSESWADAEGRAYFPRGLTVSCSESSEALMGGIHI